VVDLHFHPDPLVPVPSFLDLPHVDESSLGLYDRPIVAIGSARRGGYGELLLLQRTTDQPLARFFYQDLGARLHSVGNANDIDALSNDLTIDGYFQCDWLSFRYGWREAIATVERSPRFARFAYSNQPFGRV
jgi:hypothetical protein